MYVYVFFHVTTTLCPHKLAVLTILNLLRSKRQKLGYWQKELQFWINFNQTCVLLFEMCSNVLSIVRYLTSAPNAMNMLDQSVRK